MPLARYFAYVGGALLVLLLVASAVSPQLPRDGISSSAETPVIRIYSDRKPPEAVVFDTSLPTIAAPVIAKPQPVASPNNTGEFAPKAPVRESFAQFGATEPNTSANGAKRHDVKPQPKRKIARARPRYDNPFMLFAQQRQPRFGFFFW
jgi:hypothetical protein